MEKAEFTNELLFIERSRKRPRPGDVFVIQPRLNLFFYGKVIKVNISNEDPLMNGMNLVYIYRNPVDTVKLPEYLNPAMLLIPPEIVNNQGWLKGYFYTIGNIGVSKEDLTIDYGFWDILYKKYCNESGELLTEEPKLKGVYGLGSYGSVAYKVTKELEIHPELLTVKNGG